MDDPAPNESTGETGLRIEVLDQLAHDTDAFTQGLHLATDGWLYESTGLWGSSRLRRLDPDDGRVVAELALGDDYFGEGIAEVGDHLIWLTYESGVAHVVDRDSLTVVEQLDYEGEGWGLCTTSVGLVMSNGDRFQLAVRDPSTFEVTGRIALARERWETGPINDMAVMGDTVFGNTVNFGMQEIVGFDFRTGRIHCAVDARALLPADAQRALTDPINDILNGITHDADRDRFLMTGKRWPLLFAVRFVPG